MKHIVSLSLINILLFSGCGGDGNPKENKDDVASLEQGIADIDMHNFIKYAWCDQKDDCISKSIEHFDSSDKRIALNRMALLNLKKAAEKGFAKERITQAVEDSKKLSEKVLLNLHLLNLNMRYSKIQDTAANKDALALLQCMAKASNITSPICFYNAAMIYQADNEKRLCDQQCKLQYSDEKSAPYEACSELCRKKLEATIKEIIE